MLAVVLTGCGGAPDDLDATPGPSASSVAPGDCRNESATGLPADAEVVPCTDPHDEEVFHAIPLAGRTFSQEAVNTATTECVGDPFTAFVGVSKAESSLGVYPITPTSATWDSPDGRTLYCVLFDPAGPVEGTLEGVAR